MIIEQAMEKLIVEMLHFVRSRHFGKYRGTVHEVGTGGRLGWITAIVPEVYGKDVISPWALPCTPFAGKQHGLIVIPEKDDGVWIEFEAGDTSRPIWTGSWWGTGEMPAVGTECGRALATTKGHNLVLDDDGNKVELVHAGGARITLSDDKITLEIQKATMVLSSSGLVVINNGAFEVK